MVRMRIVGTADEVELALYRLRDAFSHVAAGEPTPLDTNPDLVQVLALCKF